MKQIHVISDLHLGQDHNDPATVDAYIEFSRKNRPDHRVWLGDIAELASCNSRGAECLLEDEIRLVRGQISDLMKRARSAREGDHWVSGNHEDRYKRQLKKFLPSMAGGIPSIDQLLGIQDLGFDSFTDFKQILLLLGVAFTHGTYAGRSHANTVLDKFPYSTVYGHTHKPQTAQAPQFSTKAGRFAMGIGCLRTLQPGWAQGPTQWTSGFGVIYVDGSTITPYNVIMQEGRFIGPDGRTYG